MLKKLLHSLQETKNAAIITNVNYLKFMGPHK